ncbi:MAG TPA: teichoic acid biosynthesis protein B, partial [Clostridiales bacterium]|nr:teichoic acid biosynthesis protein B [Clostridiales bacterium]
DTPFYKGWNGFLNDERLAALLEKYDKKLLFFPHRRMQKYLGEFSAASERIKFADAGNYDIQDVLKSAALMITDYSSVFFDFAYMRKPVIFYQFDEKEFRERQYKKGYLDYHDTVLGEWTGTNDELIAALERKLEGGIKEIPEETVKEFFPLWDERNCERIFEAITGRNK